MEILGIVGVVALILGILAMNKEPKLSGFYSQLQVCGRWGAFFAIYLMMTTVVAVLSPLILLFTGELEGASAATVAGTVIGIVIAGVACGALGFFLYRRIQKKCPENLRKRFLWDMIVIFFGTMFRIGFFLLAFLIKTWWLYTAPTVYEVNGKTVYRYPGSEELYDEYGLHVGKLDNSGIVTTAIMDK